jgi:hypothetical protein
VVGPVVERGAVREMKVWPFGAALRGEASNCHLLHWLKTVVVSEVEKASRETSGGDQEDERKRIADDVSLLILGDIRTGAVTRARDKSGGCPLIGQVVSGMEAT